MKFASKALLSMMMLFTVAGASYAAGEVRIGIIDMAVIMEKSPEVRVINNQLKAQFKPRQDKMIAAEKAMTQDSQKLERDRAVLSATEAAKLEQKIVRDRRDLERMNQDYQQDLMNASNESMKSFRVKLDAALSKVAEKGKFDLILVKSTVPYANNRILVTQQVLDAMSAS